MKKNRLFEKDIKKSLLLKVFPTGVFSILLGIFIMLTSMGVVNAMGVGDGNPAKKNPSLVGSSFMRDNNLLKGRAADPAIPEHYFPEEDIPNLGKKGFIYPLNKGLEDMHGQLLYTPFEFTDFAVETSLDPSENRQLPEDMLNRNLDMQKTENADGTVSWTVTFYPKGGIYNNENNHSERRDFDNAAMGLTFTQGIQILDGEKIHIEVYDTNNNGSLGGYDAYPGGESNLLKAIPGAIEQGEYTQSKDRTAKLFFGRYKGDKDPITLRAGGLKEPNKYKKDLFDKSIVFETTDTKDKKYVLTFKTVEDYAKRATLRAFKNNNGAEKNTSKELNEHKKYISGVMAGIGSYQNAVTVSGVKFLGKQMTDKVIYISTIKVKETFLTDENPINVPERDITFNKPQSRLYRGQGAPIEYSKDISKTLEMPSEKLSNGTSDVTTEYTMVDYENYEDDSTAANSDNNSLKHTDYRDSRALKVTMSPLEGYSTEIKNRFDDIDDVDRVLEVNIVHTKDGYSPESRVKHDLDELNEELTAYINDYPVGVGVATVKKSDEENLDDVPTAEDLAKLKEKQKEIEAKIAAIREYIDGNSASLGDNADKFRKIVDGYETAYNGLNTDTPNEYKPKYDKIQELGDGTINSPSGESYNSIVKKLNTLAKNKVDENTEFSGSGDNNIFAYLRKAGSVQGSPRYKDATPEKQNAFKEAKDEIERIFRKKEGNTNLQKILEAKRALNKAIIELDQINVPAPVLTAPKEGDKTITSTVPENAQPGDVIKVYKVNEDGTKEEVGSYTLQKDDLGKDSVNVPVSDGKSLKEGETLEATVNRGDKSSEESKPVVVKAAPINPPVLTAPNEGDSTVTSSIPEGAKVGDEIKLYKVVKGQPTEIGSYTLQEGDLTKDSVSIPVNEGETLTKGETLKAKNSRDGKLSENSNFVTVEGAPVCTQAPAKGDALNTLVGISTLNRGNGDWDLKGLGAYIALESNTKGFVITRNANPKTNIKNPKEGMLVWDTTDKCLKLYSDKTGTLQWNCIEQGCNKTK